MPSCGSRNSKLESFEFMNVVLVRVRQMTKTNPPEHQPSQAQYNKYSLQHHSNLTAALFVPSHLFPYPPLHLANLTASLLLTKQVPAVPSGEDQQQPPQPSHDPFPSIVNSSTKPSVVSIDHSHYSRRADTATVASCDNGGKGEGGQKLDLPRYAKIRR